MSMHIEYKDVADRVYEQLIKRWPVETSYFPEDWSPNEIYFREGIKFALKEMKRLIDETRNKPVVRS